MAGLLQAGAVALGLVGAAGVGQAKSTDYLMRLGQHLAQECTSCHRIDGTDNGIPSIVGLEPEYFVNTLGFYRNGERTNPAMASVAQSLDDEQIEALSLYFGSLAKPQPTAANSKSAAEPAKSNR